LPGPGSLQLHLGPAPGIRIQLPAAHFSFLRLIIAVGDLQQPQETLALDWFLIQGLGLEPGLDGIAHPIMPPVNPGIYFKWTTGHQHFALADNRTS